MKKPLKPTKQNPSISPEMDRARARVERTVGMVEGNLERCELRVERVNRDIDIAVAVCFVDTTNTSGVEVARVELPLRAAKRLHDDLVGILLALKNEGIPL